MKTPKNNYFLDRSQSKFLDILDYFLATPLFLSFIDPREHINICKDFGNLKRFQSKKIWTPDLQKCYMEVISVIQQLGN